MNYEAIEQEDGSFKLITHLSAEEMKQVKAEADSHDPEEPGEQDGISPMFLGISFKRKTDYCVTCSGGRRKTIWAYGDIHAFAYALNLCGPGFSMNKGKCP